MIFTKKRILEKKYFVIVIHQIKKIFAYLYSSYSALAILCEVNRVSQLAFISQKNDQRTNFAASLRNRALWETEQVVFQKIKTVNKNSAKIHFLRYGLSQKI